MLTMDDADRGMHVVRQAYSAYYPKGLDADDAKDIFVFLDLPEFTQQFGVTYHACFKAANNLTLTTEQMVGHVNGFVASDYNNFKRRIYVKKAGNITWGTCAHEYIHFLSHRAFYPTFYSKGGAAPDIVEGFTEYLTRNADPELMRDRQNYQPQYLKTDSWVGKSGGNRQLLLDCLFGGKSTPIASL